MEKISQVTLSLPWPEYSRRAFSIQAEVPHSNKNLKGMNQMEREQSWSTVAASITQGQNPSLHFQENTPPTPHPPFTSVSKKAGASSYDV